MAYAQKYLFRWDSSNGTTREIRILKDGYTGGVLQRALGRAPILKKQQSGSVCGTSLEIYAECLVDGEFAEFYVTDPKAYRVELYEGARLLWTGFVTPELYAEPDIAPPYDVQITATDGVGELKLYGYQAQGTRSLRQIFTYLLSYTGVGTDLQLISSLKVDGSGAGELLDKYINLDYLSGKTCYEALTYLLTTLHATITRWGGAWIICRETNVTVQEGTVQCLAPDGSPVMLHDSVKTLGKLSVNEIWPVGQLTQKVEPAKRSVTVQAPWNTVGCTKLLNSDMMEDAAWIRASGVTYDTDRKRYKAPQLPHFPNQVVKLPTIYQSFEMDGLRVPMTFSARFTAAFFISPIESNIIDNRRLTVLITYTVGDTVYHLINGAMGPIWMPGDAVDAENIREDKMTLDFKADAVAYDADRVSAQELRIDNIPTLGRGESHPAGTLTIYLIGECVYIYGARLDAQLPKGYQDRLHLANGARGEGDTVEVAFGRVTADASYYKEFLSGVLLDGDKLVTEYQDAVLTEPTDYLSFISRDYARSVALPRIKRTGVVYLERSVHYPPLMLSQGAVDYWLDTWSWNLCEDELDISTTSLPVAVIEVESETIAEASAGSASSGSSSSSSASITTSGGGASFFERGDSNEVRLRASYELLTAPALSLGQTFNERPSLLTYDPYSDAWHISGNLLVDGFITAGGKGESSSGGGAADYTQWGWDDIIQLTSDPGLGNLASAWALKQEYDSRQSALSVLSQGLSSIRLLIPSSASESNQLADKEFVNSSIASNTATFRGTFEGVSYLPSGAKLNDYAFVIATDASGNPEYNRYKYTASGWVFEYTLNNSSFTAEQWSAITSGITANLVRLYSEHIANKSNPHAVTKAQIGLGDVENIKLSNWTGSTSITTLGAVTTGEWKASRIANDYLVNSSIRIGSTTVALGGAIEALSGIASISLKGNNDAKLVYDNGAWHLSGNLLVDGYITAGGVGSSSGGGGIDSAAMWALLGDATNEQINKTHISAALEGYQTIIPNLETIRSNAANGNTAYLWGDHSGLYLPLTGGTMSNTNVVGNLNADLLDGLHKSSLFVSNFSLIQSSELDTYATRQSGTYAVQYSGYSKSLVTFRGIGSASALEILYEYNNSQLLCRTAVDSNRFTAWKQISFTDSNVASASKWANPRTITLTGSVTGSVSIDGSGDVSLATTTNHTHTFDSLTSKPTTISGYGITDALTTANYNSYAPTLTGGGASGTWGINISGNATSATKLQTSRTIWGQSFNGTENVSGAISGATTISASGQITSSVAHGTAPFVVASTTMVNNLNVQYLNGRRGTTYMYGRSPDAYNADSQYDFGYWAIAYGSNLPSKVQYGSLLVLPYRTIDANTSPDYATQIFIPNGDDGQPYMFYRTSHKSSWDAWVKVWGTNNAGAGYDWACKDLNASGNLLATGAITAGTASDSRLKSNIATLCNASSVLRQLRGVGFDWNALATDKSSYFKGHDVGLIAQEVEPLIPSAIGTIWGEYKRLDYSKITPYLVEGWKEHDTEISRLRKRVSELEDEVNKLRKYVN